MESLNCRVCGAEAKYVCLCAEPNIGLCRDHQNPHLETEGKHTIELYKKISSPFSLSRKLIICKIFEIKQKACTNIHEVILHSAKLIASIEAQAKVVITNLKSFMAFCDQKMIEISNIYIIPTNIWYSPLEKSLISGEPKVFIDTLMGSDIILREIGMIFRYVPSPLKHSFNYFSSFTAVMVSDNSVRVYPSEKIFDIAISYKYSRMLAIDFNKILITGGGDKYAHNKCCILNIESGHIENTPSMK